VFNVQQIENDRKWRYCEYRHFLWVVVCEIEKSCTFVALFIIKYFNIMEQLQQVQTNMYEGKSPEFIADFEKALATAITAEELMERMHKHIDEWPWKDR
jgi:hypothetical protein